MSTKVPPCSPDCSAYRIEIERSPDVAVWTRAELLAEVRTMRLQLEKSDKRELAAQRQAHLAQTQLRRIPRWVRRICEVLR